MSREIFDVESPLPLARSGRATNLWLKLQLSGLLRLAGLTSDPVKVDSYQILGATSGKNLYRVAIFSPSFLGAAGSLTSYSDALQRAFNEYCEFAEFFSKERAPGETRNGWSAGADEDRTKERAYFELIERDSMITHFLCPTVRSVALPPPGFAVLPVKLTRLWSADRLIQVVLCGMKESPDGPWFLGAGAERREEAALEKAYIECVMTYCSFRHADAARIPESSRNGEAFAHVSASKSPAMNAALRAIFSGSGSTVPEFETSMSDATFESRTRFGKGPSVVSASHEELCALTFGGLWEASREKTVALLTGRGLDPAWVIHPFA
jgi:hypothetical protein